MIFFERIIENISRRISQLGQVALVLVMLLIVTNVILRLPWRPLPGTVEMVELLGTILLGLGIAYCQQKKSHIFVSVLVDRFPLRVQALVDAVTGLLALFFTSLVARQLFIYGTRMLERGYTTGHLNIPVYPFIYLVGVGFIILALVLLKDLINTVILFTKGKEQT